MNLHDPCPNCGHRRKPQMMSTNPDAPSFFKLLRGEGELPMRIVAWAGAIILPVLFIQGIVLAFSGG